MGKEELLGRMSFVNERALEEEKKTKDPIIFIGTHYSNWEVITKAIITRMRPLASPGAVLESSFLVRTAINRKKLKILLGSMETWKPETELVRNFLFHLSKEYALPGSGKFQVDLHFRKAGKQLGCDKQKEHNFYFVSTPFHLFVAVTVALERPEEAHHLFFIDQPHGKPSRYFKALEAWKGSPFTTLHFFDTRAKGILRKLRIRKEAFRKIETAVHRYRPGRIFTGNDRRIEYLFAYAAALREREGLTGAYLDDGVYSYIGEKSPWYTDSALETFLKKLVYGAWYHRPRTVGSSPTVAEAYVAFPKRVHLLLKTKKLFPLAAERLRGKPFTDYARLLLEGEIFPETLASLDALVLLPHQSVFADEPAFGESVKATIRALGEKGLKTGVKYHPRQEHPDPLGLKEISGVIFLPGTVPFEAMLPLLNRPIIVGDTSTVLITAKWLRPELSTVSVKTGDFKRLRGLLDLFADLGIEVTENVDQLELGKEHP